MGRIHKVQFSDVAVTAAQDLFEILAPSSSVIRVLDWSIFQTSDTGDSAEEILRLETVRGDGTVTSGSGGTAGVSSEPIDNGDPVSSATVEINNTTRMAAGTGTLDTLEQFGWNVRAPIEKIYTPETYPIITPLDRWTLSLPNAPADELTVSGHVTYEIIGG